MSVNQTVQTVQTVQTIQECTVCLSEDVQKGISCKKCGNYTCLTCEQKIKTCPFCRTVLPEWIERICLQPDSLQNRISVYNEKTQEEITSFKKNKLRFRLILESPEDTMKYVKNMTDEENVDLLNIIQTYIYYNYGSMDNDLLYFLSDLVDHIEDKLPMDMGNSVLEHFEDLEVSDRLIAIKKKSEQIMLLHNLEECKHRNRNSRKHKLFSKKTPKIRTNKFFTKF